jgi:hypothetical protein
VHRDETLTPPRPSNLDLVADEGSAVAATRKRPIHPDHLIYPVISKRQFNYFRRSLPLEAPASRMDKLEAKITPSQVFPLL